MAVCASLCGLLFNGFAGGGALVSAAVPGGICRVLACAFLSWVSGRVSINRAPPQELAVLPGIGEKKAQAIVDYREAVGGFDRIEQLLEVPGIGPKTFEDIKGLVEL